MLNQGFFYVVEYTNGIPHVYKYETEIYARLHASRSVGKCRIYNSGNFDEKVFSPFLFNPLKPYHYEKD